MRIAKKSLSVFLAILMIFSTCSFCLTTAFGASSYTVAQVKTLVSAVSSKVGAKANNNTFSYTDDDGSVLKAAEAVYDYAINGLRGGTGSKSARNSMDTILAKVATNTGYTGTGTNNYITLRNFLSPTTTVYGYEKRRSNSGNYTTGWVESKPGFDTSKYAYASVTNSVTKQASVTVNVDNYLLTFDSITDIPEKFDTKITYKYGHTNATTKTNDGGKQADQRTTGALWWKKTEYKYKFTWSTEKWNYLNSVSRTVNSTDTTSQPALVAAANYFTDAMLGQTMADLLKNDASTLEALFKTGTDNYSALKGKVSSTVISHFFGTRIDDYLKLVEHAAKLAVAKRSMQNMLGYIEAGYQNVTADNYKSVDIAALEAIYSGASSAYDAVKGYDQTIFDEVIAAEPSLAAFSLDSSKAFLDELDYNIDLYNALTMKDNIYNDIATWTDKVSDPINADDITDIELAALKDKFNGYNNAINNLNVRAKEEVFTADDYAAIDDFRTMVQTKIDTRSAEVSYTNYYEYYLPYMYANIGAWTNAEITDRYNKDTAKQTSLNSDYNKYKNLVGTAIVEAVFAINYNDTDTILPTAVADYISRLKANIIARNNEQLETIKNYAGSTSKVNFSNFVGLKSAIENLDKDLYNYANGKGWVDAAHKNIYNSMSSLLASYDAFVASGGLSEFKQHHYHDSKNLYTTRYAGDQTDGNGEQLGYVNDIARKGSADNYDVTVKKVNDTVTKLDEFITSEDFCALVGLKDKETGAPYSNLPEAIEKILSENIFTNETVNTLVAAIFPLLCDTIDNLIKNIGSLGIPGVYSSSDSAIVEIDLGVVTKGTLTGRLRVYSDGYNGTPKLISTFESLGVYIYPNSFAKKLTASKYSAIRTALNNAGTDWSKLVGADGKTKLEFDWGVKDYNTFVSAVGDIFGSMLPLLQTLLVGANFSRTLADNFAYAQNNGNVTFRYDTGTFIGTISLTASSIQAFAKATINITGRNLYKDLWIPVMEALGVTDFNPNYKFTNLASNASGAQIARAMFDPVLELINQLKKQPIDKILDMLPQLLYGLSMDGLQNLVNGITIPLKVNLEITEIKKLALSGLPSFLDGLTTTIAGWLQGTINGAIPEIGQELKLKDIVNLKDMLGFDYTNINELLKYLLDKLGYDLPLPIINAGEVILCSSYNKNASSARTSGKRLKLTADKADVFYFLLDYLVDAIGNRDFVEKLITVINSSNAEEGTAPEATELPSLVYKIIENVNGNPDDALAAIVELFNPQEYSTKEPDWVATDFEYSTDINDFDENSLAYLKYSNDWTREKANYVLDNADAILESVLKMTGSDETSFNAALQKSISALFNNDAITGLVKGLVQLGYTIDNDFLYELIKREFDLDLRTWAATFGSLFPEIAEEYAASGKPLPDFSGAAKIAGVTAAMTTVTDPKTGAQKQALVWTVNGKEFVDGSRDVFLDLFTTVCAPFAKIISLMLTGRDISLFNNAITVLGYENYAKSIGLIFEVLGISELGEENLGQYAGVLTQQEYNALAANPAEAFNFITKQLFAWVDYMLEGNTVKKTFELLPTLVYFIQSNGLSTSVYNLLMPILVLLDDIRPILDVDVNAVVSTIVSDVLNSVSDGLGTEEGVKVNLDIDRILGILEGNLPDDTNPNHKGYNVDLGNLTFTSILQIVDTFLGTDLAGSELVAYGLNGLCMSPRKLDNSVNGTSYKSDITVADTFTILVTSVLEALQFEVKDDKNNVKGTNGEIICNFVDSLLDEPVAAKVYDAVINVIGGLEISYEVPNWGYMFGGNFDVNADGSVTLPERTIVYLGYDNDWTKEKAETLNASIDSLVDTVLDATQGTTAAELITSVLNDNVYTDANLNTVVELLVNAIASLDNTLRDLVDAVIDTNIAAWFDMCELVTDEATGESKYVCTKNWGVDAAEASAKKDVFASAITEVLSSANSLLSWVFFGTSYDFFTGTKTDKDGNYIYNDIISINGGKGYDFGIVPILEALGCAPKAASAYANADGTYNVSQAVDDILAAVLAKVDEISGKPVHEIVDILPNIIYFLNADGVKAAVNSILAPVDALIEALYPVISGKDEAATLGGLLTETLGFDLSDLSMSTIIGIICEKTGLIMSSEMYTILSKFYIGQLTQFVSANGEYAYKMTYTDKESAADMITIIISFALDIVNLNGESLKKLLGEEAYNTITNLLKGYEGEFTYADNNWAYMYGGNIDELKANGLPAPSDLYSKYANDWTNVTAATLEKNLGELINLVLKATGGSDSTLGTVISNALADNLYSDAVVDAVVEKIVELLYGLDKTIVETVGAVFGADIQALYDMCEISENADGSVTVNCTKQWGVTDAASFASALEAALKPADRVLSWLLFGKDYRFLNGTTKEDLITITGGDGYAYAIVPILEALGCDAKTAATYETANASAAVKDIVMVLLGKVDSICGGNTVGEALDLLANVIYFVNADGIKNAVSNLLTPVTYLLEILEPVTGKVDFAELIGFDIFNIDMDMILGLVEDLGITLSDNLKNFIKTFYIGTADARTSANGREYYRLALGEARKDMVTIILSAALETFENEANKATFEKLLGKDVCDTIANLLAENEGNFTYRNPDWAYMYDGEDALAKLEANGLPARTTENEIVYTRYTNNWNEATASYLNENLKAIVDDVVKALKGNDTTLGVILDAAITDGIYKDEVLDKLLEAAVKALANLDYVIVETVGAVLGVDVATWFDWCEITRDADGKVVSVECTKDWGIDSKLTNAGKRNAFVSAFTEALAPANRVLAWLFFAEDYTFLNSADKSDLITLNGGEGYDFGIVPILEALGCENVKPASAYLVDGAYDVSTALGDVVTALCDRLNDMCGDDTLGVMLDMIMNVVYFINANGVSASVNNILQPVYFLLETLSPVIGEVVIDELIGFPLSNITFETIFDIVADKVNINFRDDSKAFIESFYMGKVDKFTSVNGENAYFMSYSDTETRREMITILLSLVIENVKYAKNEEALTKLLGEDIYKSIINILNVTEAKAMQNFSWYYTEYADTDKTFSGIETSKKYPNIYNEYWTKQKAKYVADNLGEFIDDLLCLLGIKVNGVQVEDINSFIKTIINGNLYTQENADKLISTIRTVTGNLTQLEPYGKYIADILKTSLDFDIRAWDNMTVKVTDGDRVSFVKALETIIAPAAPLFKILLAGEDVSFFINIDGGNQIIIPGSEGYAYGIIPLLEALGCSNVLTPDEFKAVLDSDPNAAVKAVVDPVFDRLADIEKDPANTILNMLPEVIYFINSNGLDTCVKNIVNSIDTVLAALEPAIGKTDVCTLAGINLSTYNFEWIVRTVLDKVKQETGNDLTPIVIDAIAELTVGKVVTYKSKNGETYYKMQYASELDKADMVTILLRLAVNFIVMEDNINKVEAILSKYIDDENNYQAVCGLLEGLARTMSEDPGMSRTLYILYYIFYGLNEGVENTDDAYHTVNGKWKRVIKILEGNKNPFVQSFASVFKDFLNKYLDGIFDEEGLAPDGALTFFQRIAELFRKIINFFKGLFK